MSPERFEHLLTLVAPIIIKKDTVMRKAIDPAERLSLTLHHLAYGNSQQSSSFEYRIGKSTVSRIVRETCSAIWTVLHSKYLTVPTTQHDWKKIANDFQRLWNLPHCIGAIDGKHVAMKCPIKSGSLYYNYKGWFSIILLAVCDARYSFTLVDIGSYGSSNDSGVFSNSNLGCAFENGKMNVPNADPIDGLPDHAIPYFLVGDEAFALKTWMLRPYPGKELPEDVRIFNYRLSRARRVIENAFGILVARWQIFHHPIQTSVETAEIMIKAAVCLHNYLRQTNNACYCPAGFVDSQDCTGQIRPGEWRSAVDSLQNGALRPLPHRRGTRYPQSAVTVRNLMKRYFNSGHGAVLWQWNHVRGQSG